MSLRVGSVFLFLSPLLSLGSSDLSHNATAAIVNNESNNPLLNALDMMKENAGSEEDVVKNVHLIQSLTKRLGASGKILTPLKKQRNWY